MLSMRFDAHSAGFCNFVKSRIACEHDQVATAIPECLDVISSANGLPTDYVRQTVLYGSPEHLLTFNRLHC